MESPWNGARVVSSCPETFETLPVPRLPKAENTILPSGPIPMPEMSICC